MASKSNSMASRLDRLENIIVSLSESVEKSVSGNSKTTPVKKFTELKSHSSENFAIQEKFYKGKSYLEITLPFGRPIWLRVDALKKHGSSVIAATTEAVEMAESEF